MTAHRQSRVVLFLPLPANNHTLTFFVMPPLVCFSPNYINFLEKGKKQQYLQWWWVGWLRITHRETKHNIVFPLSYKTKIASQNKTCKSHSRRGDDDIRRVKREAGNFSHFQPQWAIILLNHLPASICSCLMMCVLACSGYSTCPYFQVSLDLSYIPKPKYSAADWKMNFLLSSVERSINPLHKCHQHNENNLLSPLSTF